MATRQIQLPSKMRQLMVKKLGTNFRDVTEIVESAVPALGPKDLLVKNRFLGINASDINFTRGRYFQSEVKPPFAAGFEAIGEVLSAGPEASLKAGQIVVYSKFGAFSDFNVVEEATAIPVPICDPALLSFPVSGLTASIALEKEGDLKEGKNVLVTAAAGGTGQFAVQIAKLAGCHVIGTCSSEEKADFLKSIGCDRPVNYKKENLNDVLSKEYPKGVDVVYECIGNEIFDAAMKNLAIYGRLIVIGMISNYEEDTTAAEGSSNIKDKSKISVPLTCLGKSASVCGFFLPHYRSDFPKHIGTLTKMYKEKKLKISVDKGVKEPNGPFVGLEKVADAVEFMYSRKNVGKVVVELNPSEKASL